MENPPIVIVVGSAGLGTGRAARMAMLLQLQGLALIAQAQEPAPAREPEPSFPAMRDPWPSAPGWEQSGGRKRAQWKNETNKRGRNR